ncbi:hypothetical protein Tco_1483586 [Tanacetum coccineum]
MVGGVEGSQQQKILRTDVWLSENFVIPDNNLEPINYEFNKLIGDLANTDVDIDDEDRALMLFTSLPSLYDNFVETLIYEKKSLTLEDVLSSLNSRELKKRTDAKDDDDGLYVRGRSDIGVIKDVVVRDRSRKDSNIDTAVDQRRLEDKNLKRGHLTDCIEVQSGNVCEKKKRESLKANLRNY